MYSGTTFKLAKRFDARFGAHQKIDRIARRNLLQLLAAKHSQLSFPSNRALLYFEGLNGPDGIKRKSPGQAELWHYFDPHDPHDTQILEIIRSHMNRMHVAYEQDNQVRLAFEAAWLAHAVVDGLTPAHHYPYEEELEKLRGKGRETRNSVKEKLVIPGETLPKQMRNNWKMWGEGGLLASHLAFEMGVATVITPLRFAGIMPPLSDIKAVQRDGFEVYFRREALKIAKLELYERFIKAGWTPRLAKLIRRELMPIIINAVTLAWYSALTEDRRAT